jgi:GntR family transcriptional repressor for pyruvate dehydrogenase complex
MPDTVVGEVDLSPFEHFRRLLLSRRLQPGDRVPSIRELARRFNCGIVAVRDALVHAERQGIVEIRPRSGAFIRSLDSIAEGGPAAVDFPVRVVDGQQLHLCQTRELLEVETAARAAERSRPSDLLPIREALEAWHRARDAGDLPQAVEADCRFHTAIAQMAGNPVVAAIIEQCVRNQHMLECTLPESPRDTQAVVQIHNDIYAALRDGRAERASHAMRTHMRMLEANIQQLLLQPIGKSANGRKAARRRRGRKA